MATPIWQDYFVNLGSADSAAFSVYDAATSAGNLIYSGTAYKAPDAANIMVKINDICKDYLYQKFLQLSGSWGTDSVESVPIRNKFSVYVGSTKKDDVSFYYNYSGDFALLSSNWACHETISNDIVTGMMIPYTNMDSSSKTLQINAAGSSRTQTATPNSNVWMHTANVSAGNTITIAGRTFKAIDACKGRFALYYVNSLGGWDFLVMEGKSQQNDSYTASAYKQNYANSNERNRSDVEYKKAVTRTFVLHTGWLNDAAAAKMHNLFGSTNVYLYDAQLASGNEYIPVTISSNTCEYKTFKNNGKISYEIEVAVAHNIERR